MNRRERLMKRLLVWDDRWVDWWLDRSDATPDWILCVPDLVRRVTCPVLRAHYVTNDMCGKPSHRYCLWCSKSMPNAEVRK